MEVHELIVFAYLLLVNAAGIFIMGSDKFSSHTAQSGKERVSEGFLFFLAIIGGSIGIYAGMFLFRHKTGKIYFILGLPILIVQQLILLSAYLAPFFTQ